MNALTPLEGLTLPNALSGRAGRNRSPIAENRTVKMKMASASLVKLMTKKACQHWHLN